MTLRNAPFSCIFLLLVNCADEAEQTSKKEAANDASTRYGLGKKRDGKREELWAMESGNDHPTRRDRRPPTVIGAPISHFIDSRYRAKKPDSLPIFLNLQLFDDNSTSKKVKILFLVSFDSP